jgi:ribosomal protein S6--L-glutamate ligase
VKIALISTGNTKQDQDLLKEAAKRKLSLEVISLDLFRIDEAEKEFLQLKDFDLIYWRVGNVKTREVVARLAKNQGISFINSAYFQYLSIGKKSFQIFKATQEGIKVPKTVTINQANFSSFQKMQNFLGLPLIVKPVIGARGKDIHLVNTFSEFKRLFKKRRPSQYLVQEYLETDGDFRLLVIGGKTIGGFKRVPKRADFRANIALGGQGETIRNQTLLKKLGRLAEKLSQVLFLEIAGFDFIQANKEIYFIEANSIVQWQGFQKTTGIKVAPKILDFFEEIAS